MAQLLFDNSRIHHRSHHDGLGGVKSSENGLFLYKSTESDGLIRSRFVDYVLLFSMAGFLSG